jgi:hypothetical protein
MQEFKSPVTRLARLFHKGRDNWREKALEKQSKVRSLEIKIRDLSNSRENWKARALAAEKKRSRAVWVPQTWQRPKQLKSLDIEGCSAEKKQKFQLNKTT